MKYGRDQRRLGALIRLIRRWGKHADDNAEFWYADYGIPTHAYIEVDALHKKLPPEMLAWARISK